MLRRKFHARRSARSSSVEVQAGAKFFLRLRLPMVILLFTAALVSMMFSAERRLQPVMVSLAATEARHVASEALTQALDTELLKISDADELVSLSPAPGQSNLTVARFHLHALTEIQADATQRAKQLINQVNHTTISVPIGQAIGGPLFSLARMSVPVHLILLGNVHSTLYIDSSNTGLNQAVHVLKLRLVADVNVIAPFVSLPLSVQSDAPLAVIVMSGPVPGAYAAGGWNNYSHSNGQSSTKFSAPR
ncbi:hypothetical protein FY534_04425 [Alicyclobacillus sp. TC]|uniref:Sporulation protein YunB n=2 Tax=Alicyclobacillus tolerans TaxID=90970 RepID=A0ABT9LSS7_9BACL|nr:MULTISPECIES: sporulation protein YunB [Alicyclobacillus]MDP9727251.1 sporulation protein YunB [Alicyclobacillus tengchongensis]QRF23007.1 hypothetical protein FY534_04425 [Alicyclobacillus sp. TC]SHJ56533.1 sporulation protein YunB [Alicyclobacillus montanus]